VAVTFEAEPIPPISGDEDALRKVFINLGQNALAATQRGGQITFNAGAQADRVVIRVHDTGSGIDPGDLPNVFRPYFTRRAGGSGIGLALAHRIVSDHGGSISVESQPGQGSVFTVSLPAAPERIS
jgi:signal transduction histidine kinase